MTGPLRIYRVLEVAFLNSGSTLRPILAKSQCWCVDGDSRFVLKIGHDSYYRIELPNTREGDNEKVEEFKRVLAKLLQYEVTSCPFIRGFTVVLPEKPAVPVKKRPWRPRQQAQNTPGRIQGQKLGMGRGQHLANSSNEDTFEARVMERAASFDSGYAENQSDTVEGQSSASSDTGDGCEGHETPTSTVNSDPCHEEPEMSELPRTPLRPKSLEAGRAITAPPQLSLRTTPPSDSTSGLREHPESLSSSMESFHSFHSPISPLLPSLSPSVPTSPILGALDEDTVKVCRMRDHKNEALDPSLVTEPTRQWIGPPRVTDSDIGTGSSSPLPQTPTLISDTASQGDESWLEAVTPSPRTQLRHRRSSRRRTPSPLPAPANVYSPSTRLTGHHLTTAILQKTCSLLLGPPVQLVALMLNIARKIANGSYYGFDFGHGEEGRKIPCSWDFTDTDEEVWEEDDYGVVLGNVTSNRSSKAKEIGGSWEID